MENDKERAHAPHATESERPGQIVLGLHPTGHESICHCIKCQAEIGAVVLTLAFRERSFRRQRKLQQVHPIEPTFDLARRLIMRDGIEFGKFRSN